MRNAKLAIMIYGYMESKNRKAISFKPALKSGGGASQILTSDKVKNEHIYKMEMQNAIRKLCPWRDMVCL